MSSKPKIIAVVPTCRPESHAAFVKAWQPLFERHSVTLVTVWDGDEPTIEVDDFGCESESTAGCTAFVAAWRDSRDLFCRHTDAVRNLGFVAAAAMKPDFVLTLDDDVHPYEGSTDPEPFDFERGTGATAPKHDPIAAHLDALSKRVPLGWMNTAHADSPYLRGVPYGIRDEAPVMLSHGVWVGTPDFDGETQLRLEKCGRCEGTGDEDSQKIPGDPLPCRACNGTVNYSTDVPKSLPYFVGPMPRGVRWPLCGMNVMVRAEALPYLFYAPMGADSGFPDLHRFADIFMGVALQAEFDRLGWACYSGQSVIHHTRASDARKNFEQEKLGREWMEWIGVNGVGHLDQSANADNRLKIYLEDYADKRRRYADLIRSLLESS